MFRQSGPVILMLVGGGGGGGGWLLRSFSMSSGLVPHLLVKGSSHMHLKNSKTP